MMLNKNNTAEKSVNHLENKQNIRHLRDEKRKKLLLKQVAITLVLISLAVISVSDGQFIL